MNKRLSVLVFVVLTASLLLAACGGGSSASNTGSTDNTASTGSSVPSVPAYTDGTPASGDQYTALVEKMKSSAKSSIEGKVGGTYNVDGAAYTVTTSQDDVFKFYTDALKDWKINTGVQDVGNGVVFNSWTDDTNSKIVYVYYLADPVAGSGNLVITLSLWK